MRKLWPSELGSEVRKEKYLGEETGCANPWGPAHSSEWLDEV